jgi:hypothetical protein
MHIARYDMFTMHILIPVLTISSFIMNDSPIGTIRPLRRLHGTWLITLYAITIVSFIKAGIIVDDLIPYTFLDIDNMPVIAIIGCLIFVYGIGYLLSTVLYRLNKKISFMMLRV